jgi:hypothetical protein
MRTMRPYSSISLAVAVMMPLLVEAQSPRAQLGVKGRRYEARKGVARVKPTRVLPRRGTQPANLVTVRNPLEEFINAELAKQPAARQPFDGVRLPVRRLPTTAPVPTIIANTDRSLDPLPRRTAELAAIEGPPPFEMPLSLAPGAEPPTKNRWFVQFPSWQRYENKKLDAVYSRDRLLDPYNRNPLKGDYPVIGRQTFFSIAGSSDTLMEARRFPIPSPASSNDNNNPGFFERGDQFFLRQSFRIAMSLFKGSAGFAPVSYELRITPEFNINHLRARENGLTRIDVRQGTVRTDSTVGFQEMYFEKRLLVGTRPFFVTKRKDADDRGGAQFDITSLRVGIQRFTSDFRGFIFSDEQPGARLFGTFRNNRFQYNLGFFKLLEKDTNSGLNRWRQRNQQVSVANLYWTDFLTEGYNLNFSALYSNDQPTFHVDKNGFLARPAPIGFPVPHKVRSGYFGISGDGHIKRFNVSHAFYQAIGRDDFHPVPATKNAQSINAQLAALEVAYEKDWLIYKGSFFFTSGDGDLNDGRARGFDAIVPNQQFAGGGFLGNASLADRGLINNVFEGGGTNFLNRQLVPLTGAGVFLFGPNSLIPNLRSSPFQGQANFINPGILLFNAGVDAKLTPKLRSTVNVNYSQFHRTEVLQALLFQSGIKKSIGTDVGLGLQYRPKLNDNIVVTGGFGVLAPGAGFNNIYNGRTLYSGFVLVRFLY